MSWNLVQLADVAPQPWKNGGGTTRELLAWPDADRWRVRLSVAEVAADGPFSRFDGVQRWFAVLGGAGVQLVVDGVTHTLTAASEPFAFDGAAATPAGDPTTVTPPFGCRTSVMSADGGSVTTPDTGANSYDAELPQPASATQHRWWSAVSSHRRN